MVMDTVTGYSSDEGPASGPARGAVATRREVSGRDVSGGVRPGSVRVGTARLRPAGRPGARGGPLVCTDSHAPDLHGSRLTPRGRMVVAVVWLLMAAVAGLMLVTAPGKASDGPAFTTKVMIEPGETLWELAGQVSSGADRHETIATIMSLNGLDTASQIRPGDILIVPAQP